MRRSGKYAFVNGISCVQSWNTTRRTTASRYSASCSPDGTAVASGNIDETGSMSGIGYLPPFPTEDDMDFIGVASAKAGEIVNYTGDVLISDTTINIPVAAGTPITWSANFGVQGQLSQENVTPYLDDSRTPGPSAAAALLKIEGTPDSNVFTTVDEIQSISMVFRRAAVTSVNGGVTYREAGNLEADLNFQINNDDLDEVLYALNTTKRVRVYVNATEYFEFDAITFSEHSNYQVQRDPPSIIGYQVNGLWTALRTRTPAALGSIRLPDGSYLYQEVES